MSLDLPPKPNIEVSNQEASLLQEYRKKTGAYEIPKDTVPVPTIDEGILMDLNAVLQSVFLKISNEGADQVATGRYSFFRMETLIEFTNSTSIENPGSFAVLYSQPFYDEKDSSQNDVSNIQAVQIVVERAESGSYMKIVEAVTWDNKNKKSPIANKEDLEYWIKRLTKGIE